MDEVNMELMDLACVVLLYWVGFTNCFEGRWRYMVYVYGVCCLMGLYILKEAIYSNLRMTRLTRLPM